MISPLTIRVPSSIPTLQSLVLLAELILFKEVHTAVPELIYKALSFPFNVGGLMLISPDTCKVYGPVN